MTKVLVLYYSMYGHVETMANAVGLGAREWSSSVLPGAGQWSESFSGAV